MTFATIVLPCLDYYHLLIEGLYLPLCLLFILVVVLLVHLFRYLYRFLGGDNWKLNMFLTLSFSTRDFVSGFRCVEFLFNFSTIFWCYSMGTMFAIVLIWFIISIPLSVIGSILASKRPLLSVPVRTNQIPRQIPTQPWYLRTIPVMFISGIFPFGSIAVEMYFIYSSIWFNKIFICLDFIFLFHINDFN